MNRKRGVKQEKDRDLANPKSKEQDEFLEFLKFQSIVEKRNLNSIPEEDRDKFMEFLKFQSLSNQLSQRYKVSVSDLLKRLEEDVLIPVSIFNEKLGALETICKYLKENLNFSNKKISSLTSRSSKSVWQAYSSSKKKHPGKFEVFPTKYYIPVSILKNKKFSVLENIVTYLKEEFSLTYHEIALLLKRDDRTIWTVYQKARKKNVK